MKRAVLAAGLVLLALPGTAHAGVYGSEWQLDVAAQVWLTTIPCANVTYGQPTKPGEWAWAELGTPSSYGCTIWVDEAVWPTMSPGRQCETIIHEYGHLLGYRHTTDRSIMNPLRRRTIPDICLPQKGAVVRLERIRRSLTALQARRIRRLLR